MCNDAINSPRSLLQLITCKGQRYLDNAHQIRPVSVTNSVGYFFFCPSKKCHFVEKKEVNLFSTCLIFTASDFFVNE